KSSAIFDWVLPSFHRVAQTEFSQSHSRSPRHRFTDVIARENVPLNDNRTDSASEQIHSGRGSSRAAAYDNGRVLFLRYAGHFFREVSRTIYTEHELDTSVRSRYFVRWHLGVAVRQSWSRTVLYRVYALPHQTKAPN